MILLLQIWYQKKKNPTKFNLTNLFLMENEKWPIVYKWHENCGLKSNQNFPQKQKNKWKFIITNKYIKIVIKLSPKLTFRYSLKFKSTYIYHAPTHNPQPFTNTDTQKNMRIYFYGNKSEIVIILNGILFYILHIKFI